LGEGAFLAKWLACRSSDLRKYGFKCLFYINIPEPQDGPAVAAQKIRPDLIASSPVLSAVNFNDQIGRDMNEVGEVGADRVLPAKFQTIQSAISHGEPQFGFLWGHLASEVTRTVGLGRALHSGKPSLVSTREACPHPALRATLSRKRARARLAHGA